MVRYREILRLTALGISQRGIAGSVGCSKSTVQDVQQKAVAARLAWPFVMGDDWEGKFDFLREEDVEVVYLPRTPEISTTQIKSDLHEA